MKIEPQVNRRKLKENKYAKSDKKRISEGDGSCRGFGAGGIYLTGLRECRPNVWGGKEAVEHCRYH